MRLLGFLTAAGIVIIGSVIMSILTVISEDDLESSTTDDVWEAFNNI